MNRYCLLVLFTCVFSINAYAQVYISDFRIITKDSSLILNKPINLTYNENYIAILFADKTDSLSDFSYQLESTEYTISKKWFHAGKNQTIFYNNLWGDNYIFSVKNQHNQTTTKIAFSIER